jgi:O-antigen ligase
MPICKPSSNTHGVGKIDKSESIEFFVNNRTNHKLPLHILARWLITNVFKYLGMTTISTHITSTEHDYYTPKLCLLYFVVASTSLGTAVSAVGRLLLYVMALFFIFWKHRSNSNNQTNYAHKIDLFILLTIGYMALSILWSSVETSLALRAWARHARLLTIPIICLLITNASEGRAVLRAFVWAQVFVVFSAVLLAVGIPVPWATSAGAQYTHAVFGSYLEQSISQSVLMGILWFQRDWIFGKKGHWLAIAIAITTLILTLGFLAGRTGHLVAISVITFAVMHELPKRIKWVAFAVPFIVFSLVFASSQNFRERVSLVKSDLAIYTENRTNTSTGERLIYWRTSLLAIKEQPLIGYGSGSWNHEYRRLEAGNAYSGSYSTSDPHQLFLLWAVEGGLLGLGLLCAVLIGTFSLSRRLPTQDARTLQAVLIALIISSLFNSMIFGIGMGDFFCVAIGILLSMRPNTHDSVNA